MMSEIQCRRQAIRDAKMAGKDVTYNGEKVYADGHCVYDPDRVGDGTQIADEQKTKLWMYDEALKELASEHRKYLPNRNMWFGWGDSMRLWWIDQIEAQAAAGKQTLGVEVVARAVTVRLTRTMEST